MYKERSGSLGSANISLSSNAVSSSSQQGSVGDFETQNFDDAQKIIRDLRQKTRAQAQQLLVWRRAYKMQEMLIARLQNEKADQLKALSSRLLLFESRLIRKQKDISSMLNIRETIIHRQQRIIESLTNRLLDNGLDAPTTDLTELESNLLDIDSLNDSDSAVVLEDVDSDSHLTHIPRFRSTNPDCITIMRSVSDALDPNLKYTSVRRSNGFLRRPEILETVYSVEEDGDNEQGGGSDNKSEANRKRDAFASKSEKAVCVEEEKVAKDDGDDGRKGNNHVTTYNRVMLNHRSVTKPKDVKYKRINKAKSKSLEELRGRLKNWVEQGNKLTNLGLEHSQSYS